MIGKSALIRRDPIQLSPPFPPTPISMTDSHLHAALLARLEPHFAGRLASLVLTRNRRRILSIRPDPADPQSLALRLDTCFLSADDETLAEVASWALAGPRKRSALPRARAHFEKSRTATDREPTTATRQRRTDPQATQGRHLDLLHLFDELNTDYFLGGVTSSVTWGRQLRRPPRQRNRTRRQSIRLGSYDLDHDLIRIHRVLDNPQVPRHVVAAVLHHEMVHATLPPLHSHGKRRFHTPEFRRREQRYRLQAEADKWIASHMDWLLNNRYRPPRREAARSR